MAEAKKVNESESTMKVSWDISEILKGQSVAVIIHAGEEYRLRLTKKNKLILTK